MDVVKVIEDVFDNWDRYSDKVFDKDEVRELLIDALEPYIDDVDDEDKYVMGIVSLSCVVSLTEKMKDITSEELKRQVTRLASSIADDGIDGFECYLWTPRQLDEAFNNSHILFEKVKEAYSKPYDKSADTSEIDEIFNKIVMLGKELEDIEYVYRDPYFICKAYEVELNECKLDYDFIKGNRDTLSIRLTDYINEIQNTEKQ